jgi:hypothetical protein
MSEFEARYCFQKQSGKTLLRAPGSIDRQPFNLEDLTDCTVLLLDTCDQVIVHHLVNCRVFIGPCTGSIFIRECTGCRFTICCKQLRTRDCKNCDLYLHAHTEPIIELSSEMRFAPFNGNYTGFPERLQAAGFSVKVNRWKDVYDFATSTANSTDAEKTRKNWSILAEDKRDGPWAIEGFQNESSGKQTQEAVPAAQVSAGMQVEARFGGGGAYFGGVVQAANTDGTYTIKVGMCWLSHATTDDRHWCLLIPIVGDLQYEDGDSEHTVARYRIRFANELSKIILEVGDEVDARYGRGDEFFPGKVLKVESTVAGGKYEIAYADGDKEQVHSEV